MALSTNHLTVHEAISDAVHRFVIGIDDADADLIESAFMPDAVFDLTPMQWLNPQYGETHGRENIVKQLMDAVGVLDTTHMVSNIRTSVSADGKSAHLTAYALAQHWRQGQGRSNTYDDNLLNGNRYDADLVFDGELWRLTRFTLTIKWSKGDQSVMSSAHSS